MPPILETWLLLPFVRLFGSPLFCLVLGLVYLVLAVSIVLVLEGQTKTRAYWLYWFLSLSPLLVLLVTAIPGVSPAVWEEVKNLGWSVLVLLLFSRITDFLVRRFR